LTVLVLAATVSTEARAQAPAVDPTAVETLRRMTDYLSGLEQFSVHTESTLEDQLDSGQRVDFDVAANALVRRPNKLRAARVGELINQVLYYDGESLTLYDPSEGVYATQPAPGTIEEMLDYTRETLGFTIPASDLVYRNAFAILMQDVTSGAVVGKATIEGVVCHHLAFRRPDADFQVWVADGEQPLPCKYVVTDTSTPALISTVTVMSDWNVDPAAPDSEFKFVPPKGAKSIMFMPLDETSAFGR
jgi:hypothetical protein